MKLVEIEIKKRRMGVPSISFHSSGSISISSYFVKNSNLDETKVVALKFFKNPADDTDRFIEFNADKNAGGLKLRKDKRTGLLHCNNTHVCHEFISRFGPLGCRYVSFQLATDLEKVDGLWLYSIITSNILTKNK